MLNNLTAIFQRKCVHANPRMKKLVAHVMLSDLKGYSQMKITYFLIQGTGNEITAEFSSLASLELQVTMKDLQLILATNPSKCTIQLNTFQGCYSCLTGAEITYTCKTDEGPALAQIICGAVRFSTKCTPQGLNGKTILAFSKAQVTERCNVGCPGGTTNFFLNGTLNYVEKPQLGKVSTIITKTSQNSEINLPDFNFLTDFFGGK